MDVEEVNEEAPVEEGAVKEKAVVKPVEGGGGLDFSGIEFILGEDPNPNPCPKSDTLTLIVI